jgi:hypothetical protein
MKGELRPVWDIRGLTAYACYKYGLRLRYLLATPAFAVFIVLYQLTAVSVPAKLFVLALLAGIFVLTALGSVTLLYIVLPRAARRETAAGYTTLRRAHRELPQFAPGTRIMIRQAGLPYLTREEFKLARTQALVGRS